MTVKISKSMPRIGSGKRTRRIPEAATLEEKIFILEFALKIAVQAHTEKEKSLSDTLSMEYRIKYELNQKIASLEQQIKNLTEF